MNHAYISLLLALIAGCGGEGKHCRCRDETQAKLPAPISTAEGMTVTIVWDGGNATCDITGVVFECESTLDEEAEELLISFAGTSTPTSNDGELIQVLPEIEAIHVPGKQPHFTAKFGDTGPNFESLGTLTARNGLAGGCFDCDYWEATFADDAANE